MKYALLTDWHVHTEGFLSKIPTDDCLYVWDFNKARGEQAAKKYNARYEENLEKVLADSAVEAVVIEAPTTMHTELISAAIAHGKHLFVDKPLAPTMTEALEIKAALEASSCRFVLSLESFISGSYRFVKDQIEAGTIGDVVSVYFRRAHGGVLHDWLPADWYDETQMGGGVTLDLGCNGLAMLPYLCGKPTKVNAVMTQFGEKGMENNSTTVVAFENNAIGTAYTSFMTTVGENFLEVIGQHGSIQVFGNPDSPTGESIWIQSDLVEAYHEKTVIDGKTLAQQPYPIEVFSALVDDPTLPSVKEYDIDAAVELTWLIEQAYRSANEASINKA